MDSIIGRNVSEQIQRDFIKSTSIEFSRALTGHPLLSVAFYPGRRLRTSLPWADFRRPILGEECFHLVCARHCRVRPLRSSRSENKA